MLGFSDGPEVAQTSSLQHAVMVARGEPWVPRGVFGMGWDGGPVHTFPWDGMGAHHTLSPGMGWDGMGGPRAHFPSGMGWGAQGTPSPWDELGVPRAHLPLGCGGEPQGTLPPGLPLLPCPQPLSSCLPGTWTPFHSFGDHIQWLIPSFSAS